MRIKKFLPFLDGAAAVRGAGVAAAAPAATPTYQFTIVSLADTLNALRKQLYYELQALNLRVVNVRISRQDADQLASTTVTLQCLSLIHIWRASRRRRRSAANRCERH